MKDTKEILEEALKILRLYGHTKGRFGPTINPTEGPHCASGAIFAAMDHNWGEGPPPLQPNALSALVRVIRSRPWRGLRYDYVASWNDAKGRTPGEVHHAFELAIEQVRKEGSR